MSNTSLEMEKESLQKEVDKLNAYIERMHDLLDPKLRRLNLERGEFNLEFEGGACGLFAAAMAQQFKGEGGINYIEMSMQSSDPEIGPLFLTLQRMNGKTPHQLRKEVEIELANRPTGPMLPYPNRQPEEGKDYLIVMDSGYYVLPYCNQFRWRDGVVKSFAEIKKYNV